MVNSIGVELHNRVRYVNRCGKYHNSKYSFVFNNILINILVIYQFYLLVNNKFIIIYLCTYKLKHKQRLYFASFNNAI